MDTAIGVLIALCCIGFAVANLVFGSTGLAPTTPTPSRPPVSPSWTGL